MNQIFLKIYEVFYCEKLFNIIKLFLIKIQADEGNLYDNKIFSIFFYNEIFSKISIEKKINFSIFSICYK